MAQINKPDEYFTTFLWTGDGASTRSITGVGLQADMMWSKIRNVGHQHNLVDTVRGVNQRLLSSNDSGAEDTTGTQGYFNSLDSDGFSLTYGGAGGYNTNRSGEPYVGWFWKANGSGSSNTDGSITSTVSTNTTSGFSIVSYTGTGSNATVGHGLSSAPKMIIVKDRSAAKNWTVYHIGVGNDKDILLDVTNAENTSTAWNNTTPTSSVFSIGTLGNVNTSSNNYIAYCFAEKKGFSKFGSYTGNGSTDGTFIYTGFKPAFVIFKKTSATANWSVRDNKRDSFNAGDTNLFANLSDAESSSNDVDFLSNGIKLRNAGNNWNSSGATYIYMCFAESPLVGTNNIPTTAR